VARTSRDEHPRGGRLRWRAGIARGRHPFGSPGGRGPEDIGHGRTAAGVQDVRSVAGRAQRPSLDAGQAPGERRDGAVHPAPGADVRGHQTVDGGRGPYAVVSASAGQDHDGPVAANNATGTGPRPPVFVRKTDIAQTV